MVMQRKRKIKDIGFTLDELRETESELLKAVGELGGDREDILRMLRIVKNHFGFARSVVLGQQYLEKHNVIEVVN